MMFPFTFWMWKSIELEWFLTWPHFEQIAFHLIKKSIEGNAKGQIACFKYSKLKRNKLSDVSLYGLSQISSQFWLVVH